MNLSDLAVRNAKPQAKPYKLTDGDGMFLLVQLNGGKYWRLAYRYLGKQKTLALGVYPEVSLALARQRRAEAREQLAKGYRVTTPGPLLGVGLGLRKLSPSMTMR